MRLTLTTYCKLNKCCLGIAIRAGSSGAAAAPQSWSQEEALGAWQCGAHFWAVAPSDQREHDVHNKGESPPLPYLSNAVPSCCQAVRKCHVILSHYHQGVSVQLEMSRVLSKLTTSYRQQLEMPPSHFTVPAQRQMSSQPNADQNPLLNTLPLVILLLLQKQVLDKTAQAQPTPTSQE